MKCTHTHTHTHARAHSARFLRRWLLTPPPYRLADAMQTVCQGMSEVPVGECVCVCVCVCVCIDNVIRREKDFTCSSLFTHTHAHTQGPHTAVRYL